MISLRAMTRIVRVGVRERTVFDSVDLDLPSDGRVALLGAEQSGKSLFIRMLSGLEDPTRGEILRYASVSFPVGYARAFKPQLTGRQNVEHAARLYGADPQEVAAFVAEAIQAGPAFEEPVRRLPQVERAMLAYALSYALPFDTYLVDENVGLGSQDFRRRCTAMLEARTAEAGFILATRHVRKVRDLCTSAAVIAEGRILAFDDIEDAIACFQREQGRLAALGLDTDGPTASSLQTD